VKATLNINQREFAIDLTQPIDISIPLRGSEDNPVAWYLSKPEIEPVRMGDWVGKVSEGQSSTNFNTIIFNPHAHGTHTECLGHITRDFFSVNQHLKQFFFLAQLVTITPEEHEEDSIITLNQIESVWQSNCQDAFVIRTLSNETEKKKRKYSHTNPPYLSAEAVIFLREKGIKHLLVDLPSVDKEKDEGKLLAHKAFWNVQDTQHLNSDARLDATITEMIYVENRVTDGLYILNLQIAPFENDASPSKPVLYKIM
jgi:kynurenine formamidase